jgi:hypothetical protein
MDTQLYGLHLAAIGECQHREHLGSDTLSLKLTRQHQTMEMQYGFASLDPVKAGRRIILIDSVDLPNSSK